MDIHDSDFTEVVYCPAGPGSGTAYLGFTPRVYVENENASGPTEEDLDDADVFVEAKTARFIDALGLPRIKDLPRSLTSARSGVHNSPAQQVEFGAAVHLSFDHLDAVDGAFDHCGPTLAESHLRVTTHTGGQRRFVDACGQLEYDARHTLVDGGAYRVPGVPRLGCVFDRADIAW